MLSGSGDNTLKLWDAATGAAAAHLRGALGRGRSVAFSPDGARVLSGSEDKTLKLWDAATGQLLRTFEGHSSWVTSVAFSPDGARVLSGSEDNTLKLWDAATGQLLRTFEGHSERVNSVAFSPDGARLLSGSGDNTLKLWDAATGQLLRTFEGHTDWVNSVAFSPDGARLLSGSGDKTLKLWDAATGALLRTFEGHSSWVSSVAFSPDGRRIVSGSWDTTFRLWDAGTGDLLASMIATRDGEWLAITPEGFFAAGRETGDLLTIVRGFEVTTIGQVHQSLYNPDLVREALAGDPDGEVKGAAEVINLDKVVDSGPAPLVEITSHASGSTSDKDLVTVTARIRDRGKGIGRIEWRVKGITVGVTNAPTDAGPVYEVKQTLALDPGENAIEVVAYNARNLLASLPAQTTISFTGPAETVKPKLYVLAIGIDHYVDEGGTRPGSDDIEYFAPLHLAVADASAFAAEMKKAGAGLYGEVRIRTALDGEATPAGLDRIVGEDCR